MPILRWFTGGNKMATLGSGSKAPDFALKTTDDKNVTLGAALKKGPALGGWGGGGGGGRAPPPRDGRDGAVAASAAVSSATPAVREECPTEECR